MTNTRKLTLVAVLSALSFLLMFYQLSIGIDFLKVDFSTIPILLALVLLDLKSSVVVVLIRSVLKLVLNSRGAETLVGLPINIIGVLVFVLAFAVIWNKKKNQVRFVIASLVGTIGLTISMLLVNYYYAIPLYAKFVGFE